MERIALSARERALLSGWERERRARVTLRELKQLLGEGTATDVAKRLARKGVLDRVGPGVYAIRPLRALDQRASASAPVLVAHLLADEPYYLGGLWGLTHHRLTSQQYTTALDAFITRRRRQRSLGHARITFHVLKPPAFEYGLARTSIESTQVWVSDPERTILDLLDAPGLAGGLAAAVVMAQDALPKVQRKRLIAHAIRGSRLSTCQRLGVLLERTGASARELAPLRRHAQSSASRLSMVPGRRRLGTLNPRWNVVENDRTESR